MTWGWTPKRDERVIELKERRVIKERNKGVENSETWGGRKEGGEKRWHYVEGMGKEWGKCRGSDQSHGRNKGMASPNMYDRSCAGTSVHSTFH